MADLPAGSRLAGSKACVARRLLFGGECSLPFFLLDSLTSDLGLGALPCSKSLSLTPGLRGETGRFPLGAPCVSRLNDSLSRGLPCEDGWIISGRASPEPDECGLPRLGDGLETINKLVCSELTHVYS
jgi:hypothetical protein